MWISVMPVGSERAEGQSRTGDTGIFSAVLYHLSYLGINAYGKRPPHGCQGEALVSNPHLQLQQLVTTIYGCRMDQLP